MPLGDRQTGVVVAAGGQPQALGLFGGAGSGLRVSCPPVPLCLSQKLCSVLLREQGGQTEIVHRSLCRPDGVVAVPTATY
jgi:hypothetical protein